MSLFIGGKKYPNIFVKVKALLQSKNATPTTTDITVTPDDNYDGLSSVVVKGDANLVPSNIISGKNIFGVNGNAAVAKLQTKTVTPKSTSQTITPDSGYNGLSSVTVNGDSDLKASNILSGVTIFNVTGTASAGIPLWNGKVTTSGTTYTVYYSTGSSVNSFTANSTHNISVPSHSMIAIYSGWGPIYGRGTNVQEVLSETIGEYVGCQSGMAGYKVTGNNFTLSVD